MCIYGEKERRIKKRFCLIDSDRKGKVMIPKVIHYCWFGGNPIPQKDQEYIASWKRFCPDYEVIEWNETNYDITKNIYMREAYDAKKWGFVPDYARFDIIYNHGGIYLDTDVELVKSLDGLLADKAFIGFENKNYVAAGLGFGAIKGHETIKALRDFYDELSFVKEDGSYNLTPSPMYQTDCMVKRGLALENTKQIVADITVYPTEYFCPKDNALNNIEITENTYSIHHFNASWFDDKQQKELLKLRLYQKMCGKKIGLRLFNANHIFKTAGISGVFAKIKEKLNSNKGNKHE